MIGTMTGGLLLAPSPVPPVPTPPSGERLAAVADLAPIDLDELVAAGNLQTRVDRKYVVPAVDLPILLGGLADRAAVLRIDQRREFNYRTVYFDSPDRVSYFAATRRRPLRFKVRTRTYLDSGACWLEVKTKDRRGRTVKARLPYDPAWAYRIDPDAWPWVAQAIGRAHPDPAEQVARLLPALITQYRRATLFLPDDACRATIDTALVAAEPSGPQRLVVRRRAFVETKSGNRACAMDRALWALGHRPLKVSKYATSLAALHPELPASKWRPALRALAEAV